MVGAAAMTDEASKPPPSSGQPEAPQSAAPASDPKASDTSASAAPDQPMFPAPELERIMLGRTRSVPPSRPSGDE